MQKNTRKKPGIKIKFSQKDFTILIVILFIGSTVGSALLSSSNNEQNTVKLPDSNIVGELTYGELTAIRQSGLVAVIYSEEACTQDCENLRRNLENKVTEYAPYVFMGDAYNSSALITVVGYNGIEEFNEFNDTVLDEYICRNLYLDPAEKSKYCLPKEFLEG